MFGVPVGEGLFWGEVGTSPYLCEGLAQGTAGQGVLLMQSSSSPLGGFSWPKAGWFLLRSFESRDIKLCGLRSFLDKVAGAEVVSHKARNWTGRQEREMLSRCSEPLCCHNMAGDQCLHPSSATFNDACYCNFPFCFMIGQSSWQHQWR